MFSVLIPSFNHHQYLTDCVLSALWSPLVSEIIVVDDGSSDRSPALLEFLKGLSSRVRLVDNPTGRNLGAPARLNQLVAAAKSEWLAPLNSDDTFVAGRFEAIQRAATRNEADLFFGDLVLIDDRGGRLGLRSALHHNEIPWPVNWDISALANSNDWLPLFLVQNLVATTSNIVFTKSLHDKIGGFREFRYCHDWDFVLRAATYSRLQYVPAMLARYRLHNRNTIKEAAYRVRQEVRRMFSGLLSDNTSIVTDPGFGRALRVNHYLCPHDTPPLAVVIEDSLMRGLISREIECGNIPVLIAGHLSEVPPEVQYIYQPSPSGIAALHVNDLRKLLLRIALTEMDALLVVRPTTNENRDDPADSLITRRGMEELWTSGVIETVSIPPFMRDNKPVSQTLRPRGPRPRAGLPVPITAPALELDSRPVVFVLPAFLAVGGVERVTIATMRLLRERWRFVVVTTEPLRPEQGSTEHEAREFAAVYDISEIPEADRFRALGILKDWYSPALIWIVNGAPWQTEQAENIRAAFCDIPIIDHEAYDHEAGWINHYDNPGIRGADRFTAINKKILSTMTKRFGIPLDKIDLIYPGADMSRIRRQEAIDPELAAQHKRSFGLDSSLPVFGMVGRLTSQKRPLDLALLARRIETAQFIWVGSGELATEMEAALTEIPNAELIPSQSDVVPIYEMLDGLVITSEFEGLPVVLLEALAMGVPALSTDVGAVREVLDRYGSGITYWPPGDIEKLVQAFQWFRDSLPALRKKAMHSAKRVAEEFSAVRMAQEYETSFRRAMDGGRPREDRPAGQCSLLHEELC